MGKNERLDQELEEFNQQRSYEFLINGWISPMKEEVEKVLV